VQDGERSLGTVILDERRRARRQRLAFGGHEADAGVRDELRERGEQALQLVGARSRLADRRDEPLPCRLPLAVGRRDSRQRQRGIGAGPGPAALPTGLGMLTMTSPSSSGSVLWRITLTQAS
jgi:hypothetical protein